MNEISKIIIPGNTVPYDLRDDYARERINNSHLFVVSPLMTGTIDIYTLLGRVVEPYEGLMLHILCTNNNNDSITPTFIRLAANESPIEIEYSNFIRRRPINGGIYSFVLHYIPEEEMTPAHWNFYPIDDTLKSKGVEIIEYTTEADAAYAQVKKALSQNILPVVHYIDTNADNYEYWLPLYEYATDKTHYTFSASTAYTSSEDISLSYIRINLDSTAWTIDNRGINTVDIPTIAQAKGLFYGTCQTNSTTAAKIVTGVADWPDSFFAGQTILIKFQYGNDVKENLTLSINGSTAAPIVTYDGVNPAAIWAVGSILLFIYSGTDWRLVDGAAGTPDWAQNDPNGVGYIKNRCGGYDDVQTKESELLSINCPANENTAQAHAPTSFFPPLAGDIVSVTVDGSTKEYTIEETTFEGGTILWFGTQNPSSITNPDAFFASDKWFGGFEIYESDINISIFYGSLSEIAGKTIGLKQRSVLVTPVKINRRYLDVDKTAIKITEKGAIYSPSITDDGSSLGEYAVNLGQGKGGATGAYSLTSGQDTVASGNCASSFGINTTASGENSIAFGSGAKASGGNSTAFGSGTKASGRNSTAFGSGTRASGENSTAFGSGTEASGWYSAAFGNSTTASEWCSAAFGINTKASGLYAATFGNGTDASGDSSAAFGNITKASGRNSAAFGNGTSATKENQFVCGKYNDETTDKNYIFVVGCGSSSSAKKNGFAVTSNGEVVMPDPNATSTTYMKARFNSDGTITLIPLADETKSYTTECTANRVTAITAESTDAQYPTAKAVYDALQDIHIPSALPNPKTLTFTGAVTGSYDGSAAMSVKIPSAVTDDHINSLIDTKLGVIENGSY